LLNITLNNNAIPGDWNKSVVVAIYKRGDRSVVRDYRPVCMVLHQGIVRKVTICRDIADSLDEGVRTDTVIINYSYAFDLVRHDSLLTKIAETGVDLSGSKGSRRGKGVSFRTFTDS
jgi:hypothetical protein